MGKTLLNAKITAARRRQWSETLKLAKHAEPGITADILIGKMLRAYRVGLVRDLGGDKAAEVIARKAAPIATKAPPQKPGNIC